MTSAEPFTTIARRLEPGASVTRRWLLEGGVSATVHAMELSFPGGATQHVVVRQHGATDWKPLADDVTTTEFHLLRALHEAGFAVPEALLLDTSGTILPSPYLVMEFVEGTTLIEGSLSSDTIEQMVAFLVRLHHISTDNPLLPPLSAQAGPWEIAARYLPATAFGNRIRAVVEPRCQAASTNEPVLLHGDFWPGNILWRDGTIAAVIDWEDATIGDPATDLAGSRLELLWAHGREAMQTFTAAYLAANPIDLTSLPCWESAAATSALALMGEWGLEPDREAGMREDATWLVEDALHRLTGS